MNRITCRIKLILITASLIVMMLALCGCRTRVTNNNEVSNVMYDENGELQEEYDLRRDELGLGTAEKPIFTGVGGEDLDKEYTGDDEEFLHGYDPDRH